MSDTSNDEGTEVQVDQDANVTVDAPSGETADVSVEAPANEDQFHERGATDPDFNDQGSDVNVDVSVEPSDDGGSDEAA